MGGITDRYPCGICPFCGHTLYAFTAYGNEIHIECECATKAREAAEARDAERKRQERIERLIAQSGIPPKMLRMTFDAFTVRQGTDKAFKVCRDYVDTFGADDRGILLVGQQGSGKTHLAVAVLQAVIRRGYSGRFIRCADLPYQIQQTFHDNDRSESEIVEPLRSCRLLVIDDIGVQRMTDYDRSVIHSLVDYRINYGRPTIYTTNLTEKEMEKTLNSQTVDRIFAAENTEVVVCNAPSWRRKGG